MEQTAMMEPRDWPLPGLVENQVLSARIIPRVSIAMNASP